MDSPLATFCHRAALELPGITGAREQTAARLKAWLRSPGRGATHRCRTPVSVALMGSWGRQEVTAHSDVDFMLLATDKTDTESCLDAYRVWLRELGPLPSHDEVFNRVVVLSELYVGDVTDEHLTHVLRRVPLLLESVQGSQECGAPSVTDAKVMLVRQYALANRRFDALVHNIATYWSRLIDGYGEDVAVTDPATHAILLAKLRIFRRAVLASGIVACAHAARSREDDCAPRLIALLELSVLDRLAQAFLSAGLIDSGTAAFSAYESFIQLLNQPQNNAQKSALTEIAAQFEFALEPLVRRYAQVLEDWTAVPTRRRLAREPPVGAALLADI